MILNALSPAPTPTNQSPAPDLIALPVSPYDPPSDLTPGTIEDRDHPLHTDGDVEITRRITWDTSDPGKPRIASNLLWVETGDGADHVHVRHWPGGKLHIIVNGKPYWFDANDQQGPAQRLLIGTYGGNDSVIVDDDVTLHVEVSGGEGDDYLQGGAGRTRLYGDDGNDFMRLGSGLGYAEGGDGDDTLIGGSGHAAIYGNRGKDRLYAGFGASTKQTYLDGGDDDDELFSGSGHSVLHGGNGDDHLTGYGRTTFYTGKGRDHIWNNRVNDLIYAGLNDRFDRRQGSTFTDVKPSNAGAQGFNVEGEPAFQQRVADDVELLLSSPAGQQVLEEMDRLASVNGTKVAITEGGQGHIAYAGSRSELQDLAPEAKRQLNRSEFGYIANGVAGSPIDRGTVHYDHSAISEFADKNNAIFPVTSLFHEMIHAYNAGNGTLLDGKTVEQLAPGISIPIDNAERQAVGLPNTAAPFDFDNDPSTPPSTINPAPFFENALNQEMGKPLRTQYAFIPNRESADS